MGVHGLWPVLSPASQSIPLSRLAGRTLAVDLSGWVCQANKTKALTQVLVKPHLRNLFFRVTTFYRLGASLVFVVDGEATQLKWAAMETRAWEGGEGERRRRRRTGRRPHLQSYVDECCRLLDCMGVPYLQSRGEAEALCSLLNSTGYTDGVLTNDSDAFLYGATTVYRDLTTSGRNPQVECYTMQAIQETLGLCRNDLVAMGLLLGCDYCPEGVTGVGKETALRFIRACKSHDQSCDLLDMFRQWKTGTVTEEDLTSKIEQVMYRKAMACPNFPREEVISEFLIATDTLPPDRASITTWRRPQAAALQLFCRQHMEWGERYAAEKATPLVTQWTMRQATQGDRGSGVTPSGIVKQRRQCGVGYYEVQWKKSTEISAEGERDEGIDLFGSGTVITLELENQMQSAFPEVCASYKRRLEEEAEEKAQVKEEVKALARKHREEKAAANRKSRKKTTPPNSPLLPQFLQSMALKTPPTTSSTSASLERVSVGGPKPNPTDQEPDSECILATSGRHSTEIAHDSESESEEELPSLSERLRAKGSSREPPLCQTNLLAMLRSVRSTTTGSMLPCSSTTVTSTSEGKSRMYMESGCAAGERERHEKEKDCSPDDAAPSVTRRCSSDLTGINLNLELKDINSGSPTESRYGASNIMTCSTGSVLTQTKSNKHHHTSRREIHVSAQPHRGGTEQVCCDPESNVEYASSASELCNEATGGRNMQPSAANATTVPFVDVCLAKEASYNATHCQLSPKKIALSTCHDLPVEECIVLDDSSSESDSELPLPERLRCKQAVKAGRGVRIFPCVKGVSEESSVIRESSGEGSSHNPIVIS